MVSAFPPDWVRQVDQRGEGPWSSQVMLMSPPAPRGSHQSDRAAKRAATNVIDWRSLPPPSAQTVSTGCSWHDSKMYVAESNYCCTGIKNVFNCVLLKGRSVLNFKIAYFLSPLLFNVCLTKDTFMKSALCLQLFTKKAEKADRRCLKALCFGEDRYSSPSQMLILITYHLISESWTSFDTVSSASSASVTRLLLPWLQPFPTYTVLVHLVRDRQAALLLL